MIEFKLIKIRIYNFACYYGNNEIDFQVKSDKNIFLFKLPNGYGKTSLFQAIKWGFYGENIEYYKDSKQVHIDEFLNDRLNPDKDSCFVEIFFQYGHHNYELKRTYTPSVRKSSLLTLSKDNREIVKLEDIEDEINQIIPKNFSDFFMFDGEQLSKFTTAQKDFLFMDSIHQLLGLKQLRVLRDDLRKLEERYENRLVQQTETNKEVEKRQNIIKGLLVDIKNFETKIQNNLAKITENDKIKGGLEDQRKVYENLPKVMQELEKINEKIRSNDKEINLISNRLQSNSKNLFVSFIKSDLMNLVTTNIEKIDELKDVCGLTDMQAETQINKEKILKKSIPVCDVCGHKLDSEEKKNLEVEQERIHQSLKLFHQNKNQRDDIQNENQLYTSFSNLVKDYDFQKDLDDLKGLNLKQGILLKEKKDLDKESQREEYGSLSTINRQIGLLDEENSTLRADNKTLELRIRKTKEEKDEVTKEIKRFGHDDKIFSKTTTLASTAGKYVKLLDEALELGTQTKRMSILKKSNELFNAITNKPEEYLGLDFENDSSFSFVIKTKDNRKVTNPSKGEKQVMAMSFLLGLNQYTGINNVILMDTPVASLDDVHSAGIGTALSHLKNQVIFLAQPVELSGDILKNMKPGIAKEFVVERHDYKSTIIEETK